MNGMMPILIGEMFGSKIAGRAGAIAERLPVRRVSHRFLEEQWRPEIGDLMHRAAMDRASSRRSGGPSAIATLRRSVPRCR